MAAPWHLRKDSDEENFVFFFASEKICSCPACTFGNCAGAPFLRILWIFAISYSVKLQEGEKISFVFRKNHEFLQVEKGIF